MTSWTSQEEPRNLVPGWDGMGYIIGMGLDGLESRCDILSGWDGMGYRVPGWKNLESRLPGSFSLGANIRVKGL